MSWEYKAKIAYSKDSDKKKEKAIAAGRALDNALEVKYSKGGTTKSHFMLDNYLKYFSFEALGSERLKLLYSNTIDENIKIQVEIERRRKMFHWFVNGLGIHGLTWKDYDLLTPDWITEHYNISL